MKIGIVTPFYYPNMIGGSEVSTKLLAEKLADQGNTVIVFSFDLDTRLKASEVINGVSVIRCKVYAKKGLLLTLIPYIIMTLKKWENDVDIYHIYNVFPIAGAGFYKLLGGKNKVVATLNNYAAFCPIGGAVYGCERCNLSNRFRCLKRTQKNSIRSILYSGLFPFLTWLSKRLDGYIALSGAVKKYYLVHGFCERRIEIIPNFFQRNFNRPSSKQSKNIFNILYVGRLVRAKGVEVLIRAFAEISKKSKHIHLFIVGAGSYMKHHIKLVESLGIKDKVTFTGYIREEKKSEYYSIADVFVHPAIWPEPFGRTLLEAMFFNVPLIVSSAGAPPEIVENAGLVFVRGDVEDLRKKLELVLENGEFLNKMKSNCPRVLKKYDPDKVLNKITNLYERTLEN